MKLEIEYHERYCGGLGCTPDGCSGHSTDMPAAIVLNGFRITNPQIDEGEPFSDDESEDKKCWREWKATIAELKEIVDTHNQR
jgi:hypothetical protein